MNGNMIRIGLAALAMGVVSAWAGEKEISVDKLPEAVLAAANKACPNGVVDEASMEMEDGVVTYNIEMKADEKECELEIAEDGTLLETAQEIDPAQLPKNVLACLETFDGATVEEAARVQEGDLVSYELEIEMGEESFELKISTDGKITELEPKGKKQDEDDEDDGDKEDDD